MDEMQNLFMAKLASKVKVGDSRKMGQSKGTKFLSVLDVSGSDYSPSVVD